MRRPADASAVSARLSWSDSSIRFQLGGQVIEKRRDLDRQIEAARIKRPNRAIADRFGLEDDLEIASDRGRSPLQRLNPRDAEAGKRRFVDCHPIIGAKVTFDGNAVFPSAVGEPPSIEGWLSDEQQAVVMDEIAGLFRLRMMPEIVLRCANQILAPGNLPILDAAVAAADILPRVAPYREIETFLHNIDALERHRHIAGQIGMLGKEAAQRRKHELTRRETGRQMQLERAAQGCARFPRRIAGALDLAQDLDAMRVIDLAGLGQRQLMGGAVDEAHPELSLDPAHMLADRRGGESERVTGGRTASLFADPAQHLHAPLIAHSFVPEGKADC